MIVRLTLSALLFASLFSIFAPPAFLGLHGRKRAIAAALVACVALIAMREGSERSHETGAAPPTTKPLQAELKPPSSSVPPPAPMPLPSPKSLRDTDLKEGLIGGQQVDVVNISAVNLYREYDKNEVATDLRLKGKIVQISGKITGINKDFLDEAYINLQTPNEFMSATVRPANSDLEKVSRLRKGQLVIFRCERMQRIMGAPSGAKCVLID